MGICYEDTSDIPACKEMQGVDGSTVVGSGGQHTEPVKTVYEFADRLAVASQTFSQFHIGSCNLSHLQDNINALDFIRGLCPYRIGHQAVKALLPKSGRFAFQKKNPLFIRQDGTIVNGLFILAHSL